jgi:hypothetical protein
MWEFSTNLAAVAFAVPAFVLYMQAGRLETGIIYVVALAEVCTRFLASFVQAVNIWKAEKKGSSFRTFRESWKGKLAAPVALPAAADDVWSSRSLVHLQMKRNANWNMLNVLDTEHVSLLWADWHRMMYYAAWYRSHRIWSSILVSYALFQAGATKAFAHAWAHSIVIPRLVAFDIYCEGAWTGRNPRMRYFLPLAGKDHDIEVCRTPAQGQQDSLWLIEDTCQLDLLEHVVLWLLARDEYVLFVLSHITLQQWWELFTSRADAHAAAVQDTLSYLLPAAAMMTMDAFGMDVAGHCAIAAALALAKCLGDPPRSNHCRTNNMPDFVWCVREQQAAINICSIVILLELHGRAHHVAESAHIYTCEAMHTAAEAWTKAGSVPTACVAVRAVLAGCPLCSGCLARLRGELLAWLDGKMPVDANGKLEA